MTAGSFSHRWFCERCRKVVADDTCPRHKSEVCWDLSDPEQYRTVQESVLDRCRDEPGVGSILLLMFGPPFLLYVGLQSILAIAYPIWRGYDAILMPWFALIFSLVVVAIFSFLVLLSFIGRRLTDKILDPLLAIRDSWKTQWRHFRGEPSHPDWLVGGLSVLRKIESEVSLKEDIRGSEETKRRIGPFRIVSLFIIVPCLVLLLLYTLFAPFEKAGLQPTWWRTVEAVVLTFVSGMDEVTPRTALEEIDEMAHAGDREEEDTYEDVLSPEARRWIRAAGRILMAGTLLGMGLYSRRYFKRKKAERARMREARETFTPPVEGVTEGNVPYYHFSLDWYLEWREKRGQGVPPPNDPRFNRYPAIVYPAYVFIPPGLTGS